MTFDLILEINHSPMYVREYRVVGTYIEKIHDASFSHEFGVEHTYQKEIADLLLDNVYILDNLGEQAEIVPDKNLEEDLKEMVCQRLA